MTSDDSLYRAPESSLERPAVGTARSLESAMAGEYDFEIGAVLREAWTLTDGSKGVILGGVAISFGANIASEVVSQMGETSESGLILLLSFVVAVAATAVSYVINAGVALFSIKRAAGDESASFDDVLVGFSMVLPILGLTVLQLLLSMLGLMLLIIPGIYLFIAYLLALPLKVERGLGVWDALETSRKAITTHWWQIAGLGLLTGLGVMLGGVLTLGIGFIWLIPFGSLVFGVLYREIFGYAGGS